VAHYKSIDPIKTTEEKILSSGIATQAEIDGINTTVDAEMRDAVEFAKSSPIPDASELYTDNYFENDYPFMKD